MQTEVLHVDPLEPDTAAIDRAAELIRGGKLVAFPTETVYGLGANALDADAVGRIFAAKGRPATNPVIVHVAGFDQLPAVVAAWPPQAQRLAERFWPGPLSLVLPRRLGMPDIVTAGGPTVAVRMPAHPVAERLIRAAGVPIAAPSANRSMHVSPTSAQHVLKTLEGRIEMVLDGGSSARGLESTVLDLTSQPPRLLRPGLVSVAEISAALGEDVSHGSAAQAGEPVKSPGLLARHYAPAAPVETLEVGGRALVEKLAAGGLRVGWLCWESCPRLAAGRIEQIPMPHEPVAYAMRLYAALYRFDDLGVDRIVVDLPPHEERWTAVLDRLARASCAP